MSQGYSNTSKNCLVFTDVSLQWRDLASLSRGIVESPAVLCAHAVLQGQEA